MKAKSYSWIDRYSPFGTEMVWVIEIEIPTQPFNLKLTCRRDQDVQVTRVNRQSVVDTLDVYGYQELATFDVNDATVAEILAFVEQQETVQRNLKSLFKI